MDNINMKKETSALYYLRIGGALLLVCAVVALVLRLDVLWVCIAMYCETFLKTPIGLVRFRSKKWINDVTVME